MRRLIEAPRVTTMRRAIFLTLLFVLSVMSPLAAAATTETQFKDGSTAYEHTFSQKGTGAAGVITLPIGAAVQSASFDLLGEASTTTWTNITSDSDYGGAGDTDYTSSTTTRPSPFTYARRDNFEVDTETVTLKGNPTELTPRFSSSSSVATLGSAHLNTTGQFVALSDQGYTSPTKQFADIRASTSTPWGYTGVVVPINSSEIHILRYSSQYMTNNPTAIMRVNPSTGQYLGTASYLTNSCGSNAMYGIHDVDVYNGNVYTAHYTYYKINKWTGGWNTQGTQVQWSCQTSYTYNYPNYITGVDLDDNTGKMYIGVYDASARNHYLKEVNPSSPTVITGTWLMTSTSYYYDHGAGLTVNMPNVMYNIYYMNTDYKSIHYHYTMSSGLLISQGERTMPGGGHYGLTDTDEHKVMFSCHWSGTNYCTQGIRKVHVYGDGAHYDPRASSLTSQTIVGQTTSISKAINSINVNGIFGSVRRPESELRERRDVGQMACDAERYGDENAGAWRCGSHLHDELPDQRLLLRLPVRRYGGQQRHRRHGGLERNTTQWNIDHGQRWLQSELIHVRHGRVRCAKLHFTQHDQVDDGHIVVLLCSNHAVNLLHRGDALAHRPFHRLALQCAQSTWHQHRWCVGLEALGRRRGAHRSDHRVESTRRQHPGRQTQRRRSKHRFRHR